jgi:hypothetical protein
MRRSRRDFMGLTRAKDQLFVVRQNRQASLDDLERFGAATMQVQWRPRAAGWDLQLQAQSIGRRREEGDALAGDRIGKNVAAHIFRQLKILIKIILIRIIWQGIK